MFVSGTEVRDAIASMPNNKAADCYGLCSKHFKIAGDLYYSILSLSCNIIFINDYIPAEATQTVICPTIKDKNGNLSDVTNYRHIALATVYSKILERILLNRLEEYLCTSHNQFGFKRGHSTLCLSYF